MNLPYPLILASTSKYRGSLLAQLGWPFEAMAPGVDEDNIKLKNYTPLALASELSKLKALAIYSKHSQACVIGSDQVCALGSERLGKPGTVESACAQIHKLQGKSHELHTGVTVMGPNFTTTFVNTTTLHMRPLDEKAILDYVLADLPLDCAGSYKLEQKGIKLFSKIEMSDQTAIIGLPLIELTTILLKLGYSFS